LLIDPFRIISRSRKRLKSLLRAISRCTGNQQSTISNQQSKIINPLEVPLSNSRPLDYWLLWLVALLSLAVNVWLIRTLLIVRRQAGGAADRAAQAIGALRNSSIDYTVSVEQDVPVSLILQVNTTVHVPIHTQLPINTQVTVPLETPLGQIPLAFPVQTIVPVNLDPEVPINATVPVSTIVPVALEVPIHLALSDTAFGQSLSDAQGYLERLAVELQRSPFQR